MAKLIVGIDPGITAAVAFLDAESEHCRAASRRNFSFSEICEALAEEGDPIIVASDTQHVPQLLKKIAATFGCTLCTPKSDMMVGEKKYLTEGMDCRNDHERDALAAAVRAKQEFMPLFDKIDRYLGKKDMTGMSGDVKELLVKGKAANIEQAVNMLTAGERKETRVISKIIESKKALELREKIRQLEKGKGILESYVSRLQEENRLLKSQLEKKPGKERREQKARVMDAAISALRKENERLRTQLDARVGDEFEIVYPAGDGDISGRVVMAHKKEQVKALERQKPKAIVCDFPLGETACDVPLIPKDKVNIQAMGNFLVVEKNELEKAIRESFLSWLRAYKERHAAKA